MKRKTLALAGVMQAAELVRQAASQGRWSGFAADTSIDSLFRLEAEDIESIYGGVDQLKLGLQTVVALLSGNADDVQSLKYAVNLLQLERRFSGHREMVSQVGEGLEDIGRLQDRDEQVTALATLYQNTVSTLEPRIVVHGNPSCLTQERTVSWIRALLFAGLRSAVLWRQVGGGRWSLLFGRRKILATAQELLSA